MKTLGIFGAVLLTALSGVANAAGESPESGEILSKLHQSNLKEVEAGKLAQDKAQSKAVRDYGKMLVTDHQAADKKVVALAKQLKVELPETAGPDARLDEVKQATGAAFDQKFVQAMVEDHRQDVDEAKEARDKTTDPKVKKLLTAIIPKLEHHLETAQKLAESTPSAKADTAETPGRAASPASTGKTGERGATPPPPEKTGGPQPSAPREKR
jgi:putative membrane protein